MHDILLIYRYKYACYIYYIGFYLMPAADSRSLAILLRIRSITHYENIESKQY
jgi:hypothetical protein